MTFEQFDELRGLTLLGAKEVLTMKDVALLSGLSVSHLYKLVWCKKIPYYKAAEGGKLTYFKKKEIEDWLTKYRIPTAEEYEQRAAAHCATNK